MLGVLLFFIFLSSIRVYIQRCPAEILQVLIHMVGKYKFQLIFMISGISTGYLWISSSQIFAISAPSL